MKKIIVGTLGLALIGSTAVSAVSSSADTEIRVKIGTVLSISVQGDTATNSAVSTEIMPNEVNQSMKNTITVSTNASDGYTLTVNDVDSNTSMVSESGFVIPANTNITNGVPAWAIKGGLLADWTAMVSSADTPLVVKSSNTLSENDVTVITYGVSTSATQPSGLYEDVVIYTATANDVVEQSVTMQTFDASTMLLNEHESMTIPDERDGKMYTVTRLADGNVWMTQNLALDLDSTKALTPADSDVTTSWTPVRSTIAGRKLSAGTWQNDYNTPYSYNGGSATDGNYYNWSAAVAMNDTSSLTTNGTNVTTSICPKGWTLPQNGTTGKTYTNLGAAYGLPTTNISNSTAYQTFEQSPLRFVSAGYVYSGSLSGQGSVGRYWSSTVDSSTVAYNLYYSTSGYYLQYNLHRGIGFSVRCVAR